MAQTRIAGNRFSPIPPEIDAQGVTAEEFMERMFEFEYCEECGLDSEDHIAVRLAPSAFAVIGAFRLSRTMRGTLS